MRAPIASEPFEHSGVWWLPGASAAHDLAVAEDGAPQDPAWLGHGVLTYDPGIALKLTLTGAKESGLALIAALHSASGEVAVHGRLLEGEPCTLLKWHLRGLHERWPPGGWRAQLTVNLALIGTHVHRLEEFTFASAGMRLHGLREFLRQPAQSNDLAPADVGVPGGRVTFDLRCDVQLSSPDIEIREVTAAATIELEEAAPLSEWDKRWVGPLRDLVVFATREPTWIESFTATLRVEGLAQAIDPAIRHAAPDHVWETRQVHIVRVPTALRTPKREATYARVMFGPADLGAGFANLIRRWFELHALLGGAAAFLFGSLNAPSEYLENRLLNLTGFTEAYHRTLHDDPPLSKGDAKRLEKAMLSTIENADHRAMYRQSLIHANQQTLRDRVEWLIRRAEDVIEPADSYIEHLPAQLSTTRNYLAHLGKRGDNVVEGATLLRAIERLLLVLRVNLLLDLDLDAGLVHGLLARRYAASRWP
jgi:hypothetical protein